MLDTARLNQAFTLLGTDLARRDSFVEIAVYGACALLLQFDFRRTTEDVDAVVRPGYAEATLAPSVALVARELGLAIDWLNDAVGMFTPLDEPDDLFTLAGTYPMEGPSGLRVFVASPAYMLALKLQALASLDRGDKDLLDARFLARELALATSDDLIELYRSVFGEGPAGMAMRQLPAVLERP